MKTTITIILLIIICLVQISTDVKAQSGAIVIRVSNFDSKKGNAIVNLFREQDDMPKKPFLKSTAEIKEGIALIVFEDVPEGNYAAIAFHDENENGTLDHRMGFPAEAMGFSNSWNLNLFSGMPTFTKLKFNHLLHRTEIQIKLN